MRAPRRIAAHGAALLALVVALSLGLSGCKVAENGAYDLPLPGGADVGDHPTVLTIHLASVEGLVPLASVKLDNVVVGQVKKVDLDEDDWTAVVTADVRPDLGLTTDVGARVRRSSLLGEWYVELVRPGDQQPDGAAAGARARSVAAAAPLGEEGDIPMSRTGGTAPVEEVLGALSLLLNNGGLPQLNTIMTELNKALDGNEPAVRALLSQLERFTGQLDARRDDIVAALDGLGRLSRTLRDNQDKLATALDEVPKGLQVLADQRPQLTAMLRSLDRLSGVTVRVVQQSRENTVADLELLRPVLASLRQAGDDLPDALQILGTFPFTPAAGDAVRGDYVNLDAKVDLDLDSVLSTLLGSDLPLAVGGQELPNPLPLLDQLGLGDLTSATGSGTGQGHGGTSGDSADPDESSGGLLGGLLGISTGGLLGGQS